MLGRQLSVSQQASVLIASAIGFNNINFLLEVNDLEGKYALSENAESHGPFEAMSRQTTCAEPFRILLYNRREIFIGVLKKSLGEEPSIYSWTYQGDLLRATERKYVLREVEFQRNPDEFTRVFSKLEIFLMALARQCRGVVL